VIDAASIGIRLALDDGVSAGIVTIRRDLAALDRAVGSSSANLLRLCGLAETLATLDFSRLTEATRTAAAALLPRPHSVPAAQADAPAEISASDTPARAPASPVLPQAVPGAPARAGEPPVPTPMARRATVLRVEDVASLRAPIASAPTVPPHLPALADFSPFGRALAAAPAPEPLAVRAPVAPSPLSQAAPSSAPSDTTPPSAWQACLPAAPIADRTAPIRPTPRLPVEPTSPAAQHAGNAPAEQSEVAEIHMDGHVLGRFVTDHLARAATRPPAGGTGFDPRLSPAWPGPASGL